MIELYNSGVYLLNGQKIVLDDQNASKIIQQNLGKDCSKEQAKAGTITYSIIQQHNKTNSDKKLQLTFDSLTSHDITYVGIIQTARASGMQEFPVPYVLTNCHNSLCAVGGTINEDDHMFALSAAQKYGGIYVPTNLAVIHSYNREMMTKCGNMILGSDSHTRYGALGTMGVGEGGGEIAKQLLQKTYDIDMPEVVGVYLTGTPRPGVGPQDVALTIIGKVYANNYVTNKMLEFIGDGVSNLPVEYRNGIDVMTTETTCWSSIWRTDQLVKDYYTIHGRACDYKALEPDEVAYYDGFIHINLDEIQPMIAMPFHPSNVYTIAEVKKNALDIMHQIEEQAKEQWEDSTLTFNLKNKVINGNIYVDQGIIAGCSGGTYDNIVAAANILDKQSIGNSTFSLSVYPGSQPTNLELVKNGSIASLMNAGVIVREAFCGPCFGAGDTPANQEFSIRHTTRNFPNREGSKPSEGQISYVALMDARSIAATAANGGKLTAATELDVTYSKPTYNFNKEIYDKRVYSNFGKPKRDIELKFGPNIKDWPEIPELTENILLKVISYITDPVTTTDELIPSGETSSFRSNPLRLAEFTLSRKDPNYVKKAKEVLACEQQRQSKQTELISNEVKDIYTKITTIADFEQLDPSQISIGSTIFANKPGDGSAREQAASCQRVLGALANIAKEYATKRYRSNLINWGMIPFVTDNASDFKKDDYIFIPNIKQAILTDQPSIVAYVINKDVKPLTLSIGNLTQDEKDIIIKGCLINYYKIKLS